MVELLIKRAKKGDVEAFVSLMQMNKSSLYRTGKAILNNDEDIADAIQESILSCYKAIHTLKDPKYFKTWLTKIFINKCNDIVRANKNMVYISEYKEEVYVENIDEKISLRECFNSLSSEYKIVMNLYYGEGFNSREISGILNVNESTIKTRLSRGREYFRKYYLKDERRCK